MAWTAPMTATANMTLTAAHWNTHVRDNLNMTAPAIATDGALHFVSSGANTLKPWYAWGWNRTAIQTVTSTTYVAVDSGFVVGETWPYAGQAMVLWSARVRHNTANASTTIGVGLNGANPNDAEALVFDGLGALHYWRASGVLMVDVTAALNIFTMYAKTSTGSVDISHRSLHIIQF